ncbi:acyltransferase family protein [Porcincola intestinalis]|uniref:Acyltransferase family protein n=1 Tax=Porcincola intestinalis TaxID=2606632 RepID=A0A6L5X667_9FIRM|nr:acyltransferase family protein [Porcincola intestinalis]MSS14436.1 acyltransferase family protein [Porcincola intestinalis]
MRYRRSNRLTNSNAQSNRIPWIDIAKGITIILTIIGHSLGYGTLGRNVIFSFHMPLFFILSGYTFHLSTNWESFAKRVKKDAVRLILPVLYVSFISIGLQFLFSTDHSRNNFFTIFCGMGRALFWASGVSVYDSPALGMMWFLISLFSARTIFNLLNIIFPSDGYKVIPILVGILGIFLGVKGKYLPFNFDVSLMATIFIVIGWELKNFLGTKNNASFQVLTIGFWLSCLRSGLYIEMASRSYPGILISVIEALSGTLILFWLSQRISFSWIATHALAPLGRITMTVLCVHHLDSFVINLWGRTNNIYLQCLSRVAIVITISILIELLKSIIIRGFNKTGQDNNTQMGK